MFNKVLLAIAAASFAAIPAIADAHDRGKHKGWHKQKKHKHHLRWQSDRSYYGSRYFGYRDYRYRDYGRSYYGLPYAYYGEPYRYYGSRYRYRRHRCGNGTTGLILGAGIGAIIGREIDRSGRTWYRYRRSDGTTGLILGATLGALAGRAIARDC